MSNIAVDINVNRIGVPPGKNLTVCTTSLEIVGNRSHKVLLTGQFSADWKAGAGGIAVASILVDGNLTVNTQINNLDDNKGTLICASGVVPLAPGPHRLDLDAFITNLESFTAHHRSLCAIDLDADLSCVENIASLTALPGGVVPCLTVLGYYAPDDGGGGTFYWDAFATDPGDDGTIFVPASNPPTGRWRRLGADNAYDIEVRWFGVKDNLPCTSALRKAVAHAVAAGQNPSVVFGKGIFLLDDSIILSIANAGITFIGSRAAALQQGSHRPSTTLRWVGGAKTMFDVSVSYVNWIDMAVENTGSATNFAVLHPSGKILLRRVVAASGATGPQTLPFSESFIKTVALNYSTIDDCEFADTAPIIFDYDNAQSGSGGTWIHFLNNLVDSNAIDEIVFRLKDGSQEQLQIVGNTFNAQPGFSKTLTVVDTTLIGTDKSNPPLPQYLGNLIFRDNEYDDSSGVAGGRMLKLLRTKNLDLENNNIDGNGSNTAMVELTDSVAHVGNNVAVSIVALIETLDNASRVFFKPNNMIWGRVNGLLNSGSSAGIVAVSPIAATTRVPIFGQLGDPGGMTTYQFDTPDNQDYTIYVAQPDDSHQLFGYMTRGQKVLIVVRNTLDTPMGSITFGDTSIKFGVTMKTSGPFIVPKGGMNRAILFECYDVADVVSVDDQGKNVTVPIAYMVERWRGADDVPN
jgi:hypothetical protein